MIDTQGMVTVAEAAKRLNLSTEQVRRKLREGKLRGERIGGHWFVEESAVAPAEDDKWLVPRELIARIDRNREAIFKRNGIIFDVQALIDEVREEDF